MKNPFLIFLGCGLGGLLRYWVSNSVYSLLGRDFPYGTLLVNITGCLCMGLLFVLIVERFDNTSVSLRAFLLIGLLGGYTTFSSFSIETLTLLESGDIINAILNILLSVLLSISAAWIGLTLGRTL